MAQHMLAHGPSHRPCPPSAQRQARCDAKREGCCGRILASQCTRPQILRLNPPAGQSRCAAAQLQVTLCDQSQEAGTSPTWRSSSSRRRASSSVKSWPCQDEHTSVLEVTGTGVLCMKRAAAGPAGKAQGGMVCGSSAPRGAGRPSRGASRCPGACLGGPAGRVREGMCLILAQCVLRGRVWHQ